MGVDFSSNNIQGAYTKIDMVKDGQQANDRPMDAQHSTVREKGEADRIKEETVSDSQGTEESRVTEDGGESGRKQPFLAVRKRRKKEEKDEEGDRISPNGQGNLIDISV